MFKQLISVLGAAAASVKVLGLDTDQIGMALGIAASHTGGLSVNIGTMVKSTHPGAAARQGVEAALLARGGFTSHDSILEAPQGYVEVCFGEAFDWELCTRDLGRRFQLVDPGFHIKRYPAQINMQWPIEAVLTLRQQHTLRPQDIVSLQVEIPASRADRSRPQPESGLAGKFSFEYCAAVALVEDQVDLDSFGDATRFSPAVEEMLRKVQVQMNPDIPAATRQTWSVARARTQDGREVSVRCRHYRGSIDNPMSREEHLSKVRMCARCVLRSQDIERLITMVETLENMPDLGQMLAILRQRPAA